MAKGKLPQLNSVSKNRLCKNPEVVSKWRKRKGLKTLWSKQKKAIKKAKKEFEQQEIKAFNLMTNFPSNTKNKEIKGLTST